MSFSYCEGTGWIGLLRAGRIGVDAMRIRPFAEMEAVARLYLGSAAWAAVQAAPDPARAFAIAWTELEARLKCLGRELVEQPEAQVAIETQCFSRAVCFEGDTVVTTVCLVEAA